MKPDKDRPSTWIKFKQGMCKGCYGSCCTMPVEVRDSDLVRLKLATLDEVSISNRKVAKKLIKENIVASYRESTGLFMLKSRSNGDCLFLHEKTRLCTVYELRPDVCRQFPDIGPRPGFCPKNEIHTLKNK